MYPRNSATPPRISIGAVVQISDGAVQSSGVSVVVRAEGGAETAGGGTVSYGGSSGIVYYAPTQAETDYTAFAVVAYKTGCIPVSQTIITTDSAAAGTVKLAPVTHTDAVVPTVSTLTGHTAQSGDNFAVIARLATMITAAGGSPGEFKFTADALQHVQSILGVSAANIDAQLSSILTAIGTRLATSGYTAPNNAGILAIKEITDRFATMLTAAGGSPGEFKFTADALQAVQTVLGFAAGNADAQLAALLASVATRASQASVDTIDDFLDTEIAAILADTNELQTDWANGGRLDLILDARASQTSVDTIDGIVDDILADTADMQPKLGTISNFGGGATIGANLADIEAQTDDIGAAGAGLTALASAANLATLTGYVDTEVAAIKTVTDKLETLVQAAPGSPGEYRFTEDALELAPVGAGGGGGGPSAAAIADAVWGEAIADHSGISGSTAEALAAAGGAGDPWITALPGSYSAGQAGYIVGTNLNATISSRAAASDLSTVAGYLDTEIAAILADTNELQTDWANGGRLDNILDARASQTSVDTIDGIVDSILVDTAEIGAAGAGLTAVPWNASWDAEVQSEVTDALNAYDPPTHAELTAGLAAADDATLAAIAALSIPSAGTIADAVWDEATSGHVTGGSTGAALRDADLRGSRTVIRGTVGTATSPSTTQFTPSALSPAGGDADQFKGRIIVFDNDTTTAELRGQATDITASSAASLPLMTFTALTRAPANGDTFSIV